jgi:hypothetical protein
MAKRSEGAFERAFREEMDAADADWERFGHDEFNRQAFGENMSDRQDTQKERTQELVVPPGTEPRVGGVPEAEVAQPAPEPLLGVLFGNVVLTDVGAEITLVVPREVVFREQSEGEVEPQE